MGSASSAPAPRGGAQAWAGWTPRPLKLTRGGGAGKAAGGYGAGIGVAGVRADDRLRRRGAGRGVVGLGQEFIEFAGQPIGLGGVERSGGGRRTDERHGACPWRQNASE